jgi:hypothetical protein
MLIERIFTIVKSARSVLSGLIRHVLLTMTPASALILTALFTMLATSSATGQASPYATLRGEVVTTGPGGIEVALPGASLRLVPSSSEQVSINFVADDVGRFLLSNAPAGSFTFEVRLDGFVTLSKQIQITNGSVFEEKVYLEIDAVSASVTIDSDDNEIRTTESTVGTTLKSRDLQNTPLFEEKFQEALPLVPGVVRGPDGSINIKGTAASQSGTMVGSANADDPVTGNSAIELPLEALEAIEVVSNPYSAEIGGFSGGLVQLRTRSGTNKWNFGLTNFFPRFRERGGSIRGVESMKPRLNFSGPLKKDKIFFLQSFEYRFIQTRVESLPDLESASKLESFNSFTRVDFNVSDRHRLSTTFNLFPQKISFANLNTFNPQDTAANFHQRGWMFGLNDQFITNGGGILESTFSVRKADADVFGNSGEPFAIAPLVNSGGFFNRQKRETTRTEGHISYTFPVFTAAGGHLLKIGGGGAFTQFDGTNTNSAVSVLRADGTLVRSLTFSGGGIVGRNKGEAGAFIQDKWTIVPRVTLDLGLRFDGDSLANRFNTSPRAGFAISPFVNNRTVIRGGVGLFFAKIPINVGVFEQFQSVRDSVFGADGTTLISETQFSNVLADNTIGSPYSIGWNVQVEHEMNSKLMIRAGYEQRESKDLFILGRLYSEVPGNGLYRLSNDGESSYREFTLQSRFSLQQNRSIFVSYTRSRAVGDLNDFGVFGGNLPNPILRSNEYSRLSFDSPNRFLAWGEILLPWNILFNPLIDWRSGFPFSAVNEQQDFVGPRNQARRFPDFFSADVQVLKDFKVGFRGKEYTVRAGVKFFNVTNHFNPRDVQANIDSGEFGNFFNGVGRRTRFKFEVLF